MGVEIPEADLPDRDRLASAARGESLSRPVTVARRRDSFPFKAFNTPRAQF